MFFLLSKVLDIFLCPYTWGVILFALAVPWGRRRAKRWKRRRAFGIAGLAVLVLAGMDPFAHFLQYPMEHSVESTYRKDVTYDAVILLGGLVDQQATRETGQPTYTDAVERMIVTNKLLANGSAKNVIVSAEGEADVIARQLEEWGVAKSRIIIEDKARNTRENALYAQEIAKARGFENVLVVTSAAHMSRAWGCFNAIGMKVDTLNVDYRAHANAGHTLGEWIPRVDGLADMSGTLHEAFGRLVYRARGYSKP